MFESVLPHRQKVPLTRRAGALALAAALHAALVVALLSTHEAPAPAEEEPVPVAFVQAASAPPPPPPPPPPPAGGPQPSTPEPRPEPEPDPVEEPPEIDVQPIEEPIDLPEPIEPLPTPPDLLAEPGGVPGGEAGGVAGGVVGGEVEGQLGGQLGGEPGGVPGGAPGGSGDRIVRFGGGMTRPEVIHRVDPVYPEPARRARIEGVVVVEAIIDSKGNVVGIEVLKGLPMGLSEAAARALTQWKFKPATQGGQPISVYFNLTVNFTLS